MRGAITLSPWYESYAVGSFPFYPPNFPFTDHDDDYNPDLNNDGFAQIEEAFWYADDWDSFSFLTSCPEFITLGNLLLQILSNLALENNQ